MVYVYEIIFLLGVVDRVKILVGITALYNIHSALKNLI